MKGLFALIIVALCTFSLQAQTSESVRKIEVQGSAEIEITPDEIYVEIQLQEYKDGSKKVQLNTLESQLVKAVVKVGIGEENLTVSNVSGYNWNWRKQKTEELMAQKSFILKVSDLKKMNDLVALLDAEGVRSMHVRNYSHSKIEDYRKEVKIAAMKAAKEKAGYLLEAVGVSLGEVIEVQEYNDVMPSTRMAMSNMALESAPSGYQSNVEFQTIKLRAQVRVVFEIQ